jgi:hypothetical protein
MCDTGILDPQQISRAPLWIPQDFFFLIWPSHKRTRNDTSHTRFRLSKLRPPVASVPKKEIIYLFRLCDSKFAKTECDYRSGLSTSNGVFDTCDRSGLSQPGDQYPDNIFMCFLHSFQINDVIVFFSMAQQPLVS